MERRMGGGGEIGEVIKVGSFRVDRDGLRIERIGFRVCGHNFWKCVVGYDFVRGLRLAIQIVKNQPILRVKREGMILRVDDDLRFEGEL